MKNENIQVAIDVGTTKVCTLISKAEATGALRVIGSGTVPSRGMQKGIVSNLSEVQQEIQASLREAEVQAGVKVTSAYVGITGSHVSYVNCRASMDNRPNGTPIGSEDIAQVVKACCAERTGPEDRVLHVIPRDYGIDGNWGVHDPIGMYGSSLEVESHVVMADHTAAENLVEALRRSGVSLRGLVLEPLASAESTLSRDEKEMGVVLVDIGGGTTDVSIFLEGSIWHTNIIPAAGFQVTRDISIAFTTFSLAAEEAKLRFGHAMPDEVDEREQVRLPGFGNQSYTQVSRRDFCSVISDRVGELLRMARAEVGKAGLENAPAGGLVLTGGTANLPGIRDLAGEIWPGPVRTGMPASYTWVPEELDDPAFATALGLLLWDARHSHAAFPAVAKAKPARNGSLVGSLFNRVTLRSQA
ncbi:MAG: cell division protein FtsA [Chloroflexota bacterium]|nr:cell division protein FtsA [Chloroflexota bacterium]MDE2940878.1 cell division protein FtsA [Chloroflexota bacterium]MDE3268421.1 cell division protein FtsA [Chloroflexota bacterium]